MRSCSRVVEQRGRVYRCQVSCFLKIAGAGQAGCLLIPIDMYHGDTKSLQQERARAHCLWVVGVSRICGLFSRSAFAIMYVLVFEPSFQTRPRMLNRILSAYSARHGRCFPFCWSEDVVFHQNGEHLTNLWPSTHLFFR